MSEKSIVLGIDHGYYNMKTTHCVFASGLTAYSHEPYTRENVLEVGGKFYVVGSGVATIAPKEGGRVYSLLWRITSGNEQSLDIYEGYPSLYEKETLTVRTPNGKSWAVMAYVMTDERMRVPASPSLHYYNGIKEGFIDNDLPLEPLRNALQNCYNEITALDKQAKKLPKTKEQER